MHQAFQFQHYQLKRQVMALTGTFRVYDPNDQMVLYSRQKMFKLREDIRIYLDESRTQEILLIKARNIIDFSAAYDVIDCQTNQIVGTWRRKGWRSMIRDEWHLLDPSGQQIGVLIEDSMLHSLLRRFLLGTLLPQNYDLFVGDTRVVDLKQKWHFFRYILNIDITPGGRIDPRMAIAAGILLGIVEGKQQSSS
jgi:uncharacterized protein YxjI